MTPFEKNKGMYGSFILMECIIWGIGNPFSKLGMETITPLWCLSLRFTLAFFIFGVLFGKKLFAGLGKRDILRCLMIGAMTAFSFIFSTLSVFHTTATNAAFLMSLSVVWTPFLSYFFVTKNIDRKVFLIVALVIWGTYLLCGNEGNFRFGLGELFGILCSLNVAAMLIFSSKYVAHIGASALSASQTGVSAVISLVFAIALEDVAVLQTTSWVGWVSILYLASGCTVAAYLLQNVALKHISAIFASLIFCLVPIFSAVAAYFILGEVLSSVGMVGAALIIASLVAVSFMQTQPQGS